MLDQVVVSEREDVQRRQAFPAGAAVTLADLEDAGREHVLDELREREPVTWLPALRGWLVTAREPARQILLPKSGATVEAEQNMVRASLGRMMLTVDGVEHERYRQPFEAPFRAREVEREFGAPIREFARELIGRIGEETELTEAFAAPFAVGVAAQVIGLPLDDVPRIDGFYAAFAGAMEYTGDPEPLAQADVARAELTALLIEGLARSKVVEESDLTPEQVAAQLRVVMFGAIETIQASVLTTLMLLIQHPEAMAEVRADRALLAGAVDEAIRWMPPVAFTERWTREPVTLAGVEIREREFVGVSVIAANRDPSVFPDPLRYDIHRANARHGLSFSSGEHHCLGVHLARMQTVIALEEMLDAWPSIDLVSVTPPSGFAFRRPADMIVRV
ncbi:MAG: cytochrome P450 [Candidatus Nanopelagicales bacterium]|jgi:cytochrome P450|nr:cytochrome P450 [Candidatus Nanopelagicales bacterium]MDP4714241.1 cytochrome P450 [Candidatus Nanopelagicales bacterium]MDP5095035.1 cytochrome P450 [Candidatus Nanopelagicales bacterium]